MTLAVGVHADATAELEAAAVWYDDQREGLGLQFLAAVDRTIQHARAWPHAGARVEGLPPDLAVRRLPVARFPYQSPTSQATMRSSSSPSLMTIDGPATGKAELPTRRSVRSRLQRTLGVSRVRKPGSGSKLA